MSSKNDDLEAVRIVADTLQPFSTEERERIVRWARERVGMAAPTNEAQHREVSGTTPPVAPASADIKQFVNEKAPQSDVHFAATVAYYHQFLAPEQQRKASITKEDLVEACRKVTRKQPKRPAQVLVNAYQDGVLDRGEKGRYSLNSVGENLVAMALPDAGDGTSRKTAKRPAVRKGKKARAPKKGKDSKKTRR